jgi:protease IV
MKIKACCWVLIGIGILIALFFVTTGIMISTLASKAESKPAIADKSYLMLELTGVLPEYNSSPSGFEFLSQASRTTTLANAEKALQYAADDPKIVGVILRPTAIGGFAGIRELRMAIQQFKKSKKPVYAHLELATDRDYYLASVADSIFMTPAKSGGLAMLGLGISSTYLAKTFEKVGITFHALHVGQYKGAYENLSRESMSDPLRESLQYLLDDMYKTYSTEITASRPALAAGAVDHEILNGDKFLIVGPEAVKKGFADRTVEWNDLREQLSKGSKELHTIAPGKYVKAVQWKEKGKREIAVLFAEGEISYKAFGADPLDFNTQGIEANALVKQIRELRKDDNVAAVVLRVNSPGGSAYASELILNELQHLKAVKPIVVSMGNVAASGGYYISCMANKIVAQPNTITGSIGVVSVFPTAEGLFKKIGAKVETVEKGKWGEFFRVDQDLPPEKQAVLMDYMNGVYDEFVSHVAEGRSLSVAAVTASASGRVWTGTQALDRKLVDEIGGLDVAVQRAKELGKVTGESVKVRYYPRQKDFFTFFMDRLDATVKSVYNRMVFTPEQVEIQQALDYFRQFVNQREFVQALLPLTLP